MRTVALTAMTELQRDRLGRIIEATLRLLAEVGAEKLTVSNVAAASRVASSTLYNRFGTKDGLLAAAVVDYFERAIAARVDHRRAKTPIRKIVNTIDLVTHSVLQAKSFTHALMGAYFKVTENHTMQRQLTHTVQTTWKSIVAELEAGQSLLPWVSLDLLARDLCDREFNVVLRWSQEQICDQELRDQLQYALLTPILAVSRGGLRTELTSTIAKLTRRLARQNPDPRVLG